MEFSGSERLKGHILLSTRNTLYTLHISRAAWLNWEILTEFQCKKPWTDDGGKDRLQRTNTETLLWHKRMLSAKSEVQNAMFKTTRTSRSTSIAEGSKGSGSTVKRGG